MLDVAAIRKRREEVGLTQMQAAQKAGFSSRQAWSKVESGSGVSVTLATLNKIAEALGVRAKDLLK